MLLHQFREHFVLGLQLGLKLLDPFLFNLVLGGMLFFESCGSVLEKFLLPTIEGRWLQIVFIAQIGDGYPVNQMPFEDDHFFVSLVIFTMFAHGEFLRFCTLTQTIEFSNSC